MQYIFYTKFCGGKEQARRETPEEENLEIYFFEFYTFA